MGIHAHPLSELIAALAATEPAPSISLDAIVTEEKRRGYGTKARLKVAFREYQKIGLLGRAIAKERRQGGGGLWHPSQGAIFDWYLQLRKTQNADTISMANIPIAFWLLDSVLGDWYPISIEQAQRAFAHATKGLAARWTRRVATIDQSKTSSKVRQSIQETMRAFTSRGRKIKTTEDRRILDEFARLDFNRAQPGVSLEDFMKSGLVLRDTHPEFQETLKGLFYKEEEARLLGLKYHSELARPAAQPFWYWARKHWLAAMEWGMQREDWFKSITGQEMVPQSLNTILRMSIVYLLGEFGRGIQRLEAGDALEGVPPIRSWLISEND